MNSTVNCKPTVIDKTAASDTPSVIGRSTVSGTTIDERGMGGVEVLPVATLVLLFVSLFVIGCWSVVDAKSAADAAAREGARTAVETFDAGASISAATDTWEGHGRATPLHVSVQGTFTRCARITVTTSAQVSVVPVSFLRQVSAMTVVAHHSEVVDPYRPGLEGSAAC